jgi:hypothetical protein
MAKLGRQWEDGLSLPQLDADTFLLPEQLEFFTENPIRRCGHVIGMTLARYDG